MVGSGAARRSGAPSVFSDSCRVPPGRFLLLGDNRDALSDSRTWRQPCIERKALVGRLVRRRAHRSVIPAQAHGGQVKRNLILMNSSFRRKPESRRHFRRKVRS